MPAAQTLDAVARAAGFAALALGLVLWGGRLHGLVSLHMALGAGVVLALWGLAVLALRRGTAPGLAVLASVWGLATLALGSTQAGLLVGDLHWIVGTTHLLLGLGAVALAAVLARALRAGPTR